MISDQIAYLSGKIPGGIWLVPILGIIFTLIWFTVWKGTGFWSRKHYHRLLWRGWLILIILYSIAWSINRPPPIPIRIIVSADLSDTNNDNAWQVRGIADLVEQRLRISPKSFTLINEEFCPVLKGISGNSARLDSLAHLMKVQWLIVAMPPGDKSAGSFGKIRIQKHKGKGYSERASITAAGESFIASSLKSADETARALGDEPLGDDWQFGMVQPTEDQLSELYRAFLLRDNGQFDLATSVFATLKSSNPKWQRPYLELASTWLLHMSTGHADSIRQVLFDGLDVDSHNPEMYPLLGRYFLEYSNWQEAESALKIAYNYDSGDPRTFFYLSRLTNSRLSELPMKSKKELLEWAINLAPGYEAARIAMVRGNLFKFEYREALNLLNEGLVINPNSTLLLLSLSATNLELGRKEVAAQACRKILSIEPENSDAYYNLGIALVSMDKYDEAISMFERSLTLGGSQNNLYYIGIAYERKGDFKKAIESYRRRLSDYHSTDDRTAEAARERIKTIEKEMVQGGSQRTPVDSKEKSG